MSIVDRDKQEIKTKHLTNSLKNPRQKITEALTKLRDEQPQSLTWRDKQRILVNSKQLIKLNIEDNSSKGLIIKAYESLKLFKCLIQGVHSLITIESSEEDLHDEPSNKKQKN